MSQEGSQYEEVEQQEYNTEEQQMLEEMMANGEYDDGEEEEYDEEEMEGEEYYEQEMGDEQEQYQETLQHDDEEYEQKQSNLQTNQQQSDQEEEETPEFDNDFKMIKQIRKMILDNLNRERVLKELCPFYIDVMLNDLAQEYSYFLKGNPHDPAQIASLCEDYKCTTDYQLIYASSKFEDNSFTKDKIISNFRELGYVLCECQEEKQLLFDSQFNHLGLGITATEKEVIIVMFLSYSKLVISQLYEDDNKKLRIHGKMLDQRFGLFAISVQNTIGKDLIPYVSPEFIDFDRESKKFVVNVDIENPFSLQVKKYIGFYVRANPDSIPYKKFFREKINLKHLEAVMKIPCQPFPNLQIMDLNDDEIFLKKFQEEENQKKNQEIERKRLIEDEEKRQQGYFFIYQRLNRKNNQTRMSYKRKC